MLPAGPQGVSIDFVQERSQVRVQVGWRGGLLRWDSETKERPRGEVATGDTLQERSGQHWAVRSFWEVRLTVTEVSAGRAAVSSL